MEGPLERYLLPGEHVAIEERHSIPLTALPRKEVPVPPWFEVKEEKKAILLPLALLQRLQAAKEAEALSLKDTLRLLQDCAKEGLHGFRESLEILGLNRFGLDTVCPLVLPARELPSVCFSCFVQEVFTRPLMSLPSLPRLVDETLSALVAAAPETARHAVALPVLLRPTKDVDVKICKTLFKSPPIVSACLAEMLRADSTPWNDCRIQVAQLALRQGALVPLQAAMLLAKLRQALETELDGSSPAVPSFVVGLLSGNSKAVLEPLHAQLEQVLAGCSHSMAGLARRQVAKIKSKR